jgi:hypothetical protein
MLIDLSSGRLATASISDERLERLTQTFGCQAVAPLTDRIFEFSSGFVAWSQQAFVGTWQGEDGATIWLAQPLADPHPILPLDVKLGDKILLHGADLEMGMHSTQQALYLSLYWQSLSPLAVDYKIFVHLRDGENNTVVNGDHLPYDNLVPTTRWPTDGAIKETIQLIMPGGGAREDYQLFVGMYDPNSQERLPVEDDESGENAIIIPVAWDLF